MTSYSIKGVYILGIIGLGVLFAHCTQDKAFPPSPPADTTSTQSLCDTVGLSYDKEVEPVMSKNCAISGCHSSSSSAGGVSLETYKQVKQEATTGDLLCTIKHNTGCTNMPRGGDQLPDSTIQMIDCWVKNDTPQ